MRRTEGTVERVVHEADGRSSAWIQCPPEAIPGAGQATLALPLAQPHPLRLTLYPLSLRAGHVKLPVPAGHRWQPGDRLDLLGPIGTGFQPPTRSERWLLWAYRAPLYPLRPLLELGLGSGRALVVASGQVLHGLPPEVEVVRQASTAIAWADYLAICLSPTHLAEVLSALDPPDRLAPLPTGQALLYSQLPCGFGGCGACGLPTGDGWRSACTDGPVFPLEELLGG